MTPPLAELVLPPSTAAPGCSDALADARLALAVLRSEAEDLGRPRRAEAFHRLALMTDVWECLADDAPRQAAEVSAFCAEGFERLAAESGPCPESAPDWVLRESSSRWGDYLGLLDDETGSGTGAGTGVGWSGATADPDQEDAPSAIDAGSLFRMLTGSQGPAAPAESTPQTPPPHPGLWPKTEEPGPPPPRGGGLWWGAPEPTPEPRHEAPTRAPFEVPSPPSTLAIDQDMRETFLGEAGDLFDRIESLVLSLGGPRTGPQQADALHELARCFHTLKGAAGSVGLLQLAALIHAMEEQLELAGGEPSAGLIDLLHRLLHYLEGVFIALRRHGAPPPPLPHEPSENAPAPPPLSPDGPPAEGVVRVAAERVDELMDLASELIGRRGLWESQASAVKQFATQARASRARLLNSIDRFRDLLHAAPPSSLAASPARRGDDVAELVRRLAEQADDLVVLTDAAQATAGPLSDNSDALARLSLRLWESLQAVRIVPVRGLFQRLARVAHDAARVEGRQVEVVLSGEETGVDRAVQDKAFEPLLHVVRNAVCHGIESPEDRRASGKPMTGRITLSASRTGNTLCLSVGDDGRGLDLAAIEAKGRRVGLIAPGDTPTTERLSALIFQQGFSTRDQAGAMAGRGVGMDVVSQEVARLHGSVALASRSGLGTTLSVSLPARLALQQSMILRVDGQAFALPVELVDLVQPFEPGADDPPDVTRVRDEWLPMTSAREALGLSTTAAVSCPKLLSTRCESGALAVVADAIDGTSELVIKPLGPLLAGHPMISGTSLSETGEVIFALNPAGLARSPRGGTGGARFAPPEEQPVRPAVLVVDDSISVRTVVARWLRGSGYEVDEVSDGMEALAKIRKHATYSLILSDLEMPRMDGLELLAELNRLGVAPAVPVVMTSTRSDPETRRRVLGLGARAFLPKPIDPDSFAATVRGLIPGSVPDSFSPA